MYLKKKYESVLVQYNLFGAQVGSIFIQEHPPIGIQEISTYNRVHAESKPMVGYNGPKTRIGLSPSR